MSTDTGSVSVGKDGQQVVKRNYTVGAGHVAFGQSTYDVQTVDASILDQTLVQIAAFDVSSRNILLAETIVTDQDLDQYVIKGQIAGGTLVTLYSASADYTSPDANGFILAVNKNTTATGLDAADKDLTTTAALEEAWIKLNVGAFDTIEIWAACAADNGNAVTYGNAQ